ncbi:unnamed protein product [Brassica oleracea]
MAIPQCTSCGLTLQHCQCRRQASTTAYRRAYYPPLEITPVCYCGCYSCWSIVFVLVFLSLSGKLLGEGGCYLELFAHSVSVSNTNVTANISTADWRVGLVAMSPVTGCKISFHTIKPRLLRGEEVVSETSPSVDGFGQVVTSDKTDGPVISVDFKRVVTPGIIGDVVRGYRVEIVAGVDSDGFLMVLCGDLPVKFTADPAGNVIGSLLGNMKRRDVKLVDPSHHVPYRSGLISLRIMAGQARAGYGLQKVVMRPRLGNDHSAGLRGYELAKRENCPTKEEMVDRRIAQQMRKAADIPEANLLPDVEHRSNKEAISIRCLI